MTSSEMDPGGPGMTLTVPNPRRSSAREANVLQDGRKRQKLSHSPKKESQRQKTNEIADETSRVLKSQESGSSDQSGSKWFIAANKNISTSQRGAVEIDSTSASDMHAQCLLHQIQYR